MIFPAVCLFTAMWLRAGTVRRWIMAALAGAMVLAALVGNAFAADKLTVRFDWLTSPNQMPYYLAMRRGWFKAANLDVSVEDGTGSTTAVQLVAAGRFDVGQADLSPMMVARGHGIPVISIAGIIRHTATGFIVPKTMQIKSLKDLIGKKIIYTAGSFEGPLIVPLFEAHGISPDQVKLLNLDAASKTASYIAGQGDVAILPIPVSLPEVAGKRDSYAVPLSDFGLDLPSIGLVSSAPALKEKGAAIRRFVSIICGAWTYILESRTHMVEAADAIYALRPDTPLPKDLMLAEGEAYRPYFYTDATKDEPIGIQSDIDWKRAIASMEGAKLIPPGTTPSDYYTNDYIDVDLLKKIAAMQ